MINRGFVIIPSIVLLLAVCFTGCGGYKYSGDVDFTKYEWLKGKKIFLDPGHGGKGDSDLFRTGPGGITEEEVNLRVALILRDMLEKAGAVVSMSREDDDDIPLEERVIMVKEIQPQLLVSLHHNGTARRMDKVNYPAVLIWGNKRVRPESYDFASLLLDEFHRIMDEKGSILSDFSIYTETGTMILRETRYVCPGVIGEPGFFSDETNSIQLKDIHYNQQEAEAYFYAIARFFERGIPGAEVLISVPLDSSGYTANMIKEESPIIALRVSCGADGVGVDMNSMKATLDGIPVKCKPVSDNLFIVKYGTKLYPGGHSIRFQFKNARSQNSMVYSSGFVVEIKEGDCRDLADRGMKLVMKRKTAEEGLKMLLAAYSMSVTDPDADRIIWHIAKGFSMIGNRDNSEYYYSKLYNFYPQSRYARELEKRMTGYRFPVDYKGKWISPKYEPSLKE